MRNGEGSDAGASAGHAGWTLVAPNLPLLLAARGAQGIGAALLMPNSLAILGNAFVGEARGRAIGTWAAAGAIATAVGPPLGGWLIDAVGWRAIFAINIPVSLAAIALAMRYVDESETSDQPLDWAGAGLATLALGMLAWALTLWSSHHVTSQPVVIGSAAGLLLLGGFIWVEHRRGEGAMMPLAMFGSSSFIGLSMLTFLLYWALGGLLVLLPYVLIVAGGYSSMSAGLSLLPVSIVIGTMSRLMGRIAERVGPRWPLTLGPIVTAVGFALMTRLDPRDGYWLGVAPGLVLIALGMAGAVAPLTTAVLSSVDSRHTGTASGFNSAISRTGGLIATALSGAVIANPPATLLPAFHGAEIVAAGAAFLSGLAAYAALSKESS
ncbi:MAG: MFS transporter [Sphingomonadales bacterium]|nr:MFS transporter [Sphingomonadales bacterium]MDE2171536.1 MFS transporter [Sphingomonadales bacterium]